MKRVLQIIALCLVVPMLSSCAVGMAMAGKAEPQMRDISKGMPMDEVHFILRDYTPVVNERDNSRIETYTIQIGNEPNIGRALCHLIMDLWTWGLWEIVGTPMEALNSKELMLTIHYTVCPPEEGWAKLADGENIWIVERVVAGKTKGGI